MKVEVPVLIITELPVLEALKVEVAVLLIVERQLVGRVLLW